MLLFLTVHLILIGTEAFLLSEFGMIIGQDAIDVLSETNARETSEFIGAYCNLHLLKPILFSLAALVFAYVTSAYIASSRYVRWLIIALCVYGSVLIAKGAYSFIQYHNGEGLPQLTTITRGGYAYYVMRQRANQFSTILEASQQCDATIEDGFKPFRHVVVVIGESSSFYHCSLYGYSKETFPHMSTEKDNGSLIAFNDVVTPFDATHGVMKCIFSLDHDNFGKAPLFPALFRKVGYYTQLLDNQYFVSQGINFLTNAELSAALFENRNDGYYGHDGRMLTDICLADSLSLTILHLNGQHYTYSDRFPESFAQFKPDDYDVQNKSFEQRQVMAAYDNAGRYCDHVINEVIKLLKDEDALLVFLSDHGEEVYDVRDYMGHGSALSSPDPNYLLKVPFFVWMSNEARVYRKSLYDKLLQSESTASITTNFSHFLLTLCGIRSTSVVPEKCFFSDRYDRTRPRIVLNSIDYDKEMK
ncbi:MAG: phosphoethanolamine transferase [Prevotellaceae bacterium]|nr:phosphoethanolamine transferase [Candidatus Minthosoma equi]